VSWGSEWKAAAGQERIDSALHLSDVERAALAAGQASAELLSELFRRVHGTSWRDSVRADKAARARIAAVARAKERRSVWAWLRAALSDLTPRLDLPGEAQPALKSATGHGRTVRRWGPSAGDLYGLLLSSLVLSTRRVSAESELPPELTFGLPESLTGLKMEGPMRVFYMSPLLEGGSAGHILSIELLEGAWAVEKLPKPPPPELIVDEEGILLPLAD
jgi:hypothetical protein